MNYTVENNPREIFTSDIDADNDIDILVTYGQEWTGLIYILLNNGSGSYSSIINYNLSVDYSSLILQDINCNGYDDLVLTDGYSIYILFNNGDGTFQSPIACFTGNNGYNPFSICSADFNNDGYFDVAFLDDNRVNVIILINNISIKFTILDILYLADGMTKIYTFNIDNDEDIDLFLSGGGASWTLATLKNDGNGKFQEIRGFWHDSFYSTSFFPSDLDGDKDLDIISINNLDRGLYIFVNDNSTFFNKDTLTMNWWYNVNPNNAISCDIDNDLDLDIIVSKSGTDDISIITNQNIFSSRIQSSFSIEQSDTILFNYSISNPDSNNTSLQCRYSIDTANVWYSPTIIGDTSNISPINYEGTFLWNSYSDLPGADLENVQFKITPQDCTGIGRSDSTGYFHLDNNRVPAVDIDSIQGEQTVDINISYHLSDLENDTLQIKCEYLDPSSQLWNPATITGKTSGIVNYDSSIIWNSLIDLPITAAFVLFRIIPHDNDQGLADSIIIELDQIGASVANLITQVAGEYSSDITFEYLLSDDELDTIDLICEYSINSGLNWSPATMSGNITGIIPANYSDSLVWHSATDLPGIDKNTIRFKITPFDGHYGFPDETVDFHLDNNLPPLVQVSGVLSPNSGLIEIPFTIQDTENDTISFTGRFQSDGGNWEPITEDSTNVFTSVNYHGIYEWKSIDDLGFGEFQSVQIQLVPMDNDTGTEDISNTFDVFNYAGDYSGDIQIDYDDMLQFALAWGIQDLSKEIGPATGTPPLLIPQPDGVVDFEDLMVLVQQWNWSYDNPGMLVKVFFEENKNEITFNKPQAIHINTNENEIEWTRAIHPDHTQKISNTINKHLISIAQSDYDPWSNEFADNIDISIDTTAKILGLYLEIEYDPNILTITETDNQLLKDQNGFTFKTADEQTGRLIINSIVLTDVNKLSEINGQLLNFSLQSKQTAETSIEYTWQIHNQSGTIISSGKNSFDMTVYETIPKSYALYQNFPNPFNPKTTIRYQLPVDSKVKLEIYNILGEKVITLVNEDQQAGYYSKVWDINRIHTYASGVYIYRISVSGKDNTRYVKSKKMMLLK